MAVLHVRGNVLDLKLIRKVLLAEKAFRKDLFPVLLGESMEACLEFLFVAEGNERVVVEDLLSLGVLILWLEF